MRNIDQISRLFILALLLVGALILTSLTSFVINTTTDVLVVLLLPLPIWLQALVIALAATFDGILIFAVVTLYILFLVFSRLELKNHLLTFEQRRMQTHQLPRSSQNSHPSAHTQASHRRQYPLRAHRSNGHR